MDLFPRDKRDGVFRGFQQGGLEFHADLVLPYRNDLQNVPMHGQFLLVQLEHEDEAVLGRIASFSSEGKLAFGSGEEFNIWAMLEDRVVPDDLREQYLRYRAPAWHFRPRNCFGRLPDMTSRVPKSATWLSASTFITATRRAWTYNRSCNCVVPK